MPSTACIDWLTTIIIDLIELIVFLQSGYVFLVRTFHTLNVQQNV